MDAERRSHTWGADKYGFAAKSARRHVKQTYVHRTVLIAFNSQLRRHRRQVLLALAVAAVALGALEAHSALMNAGVDNHAMSDGAAICLAVGGSLALAGAAVFAVRQLRQRPRWLIPTPTSPSLPFVSSSTGFLARAGPPALLQAFRL